MPDMFTLLVCRKDACMPGILAQQLALQKKYAYRHPLIGDLHMERVLWQLGNTW